ncbi:hypothetical protein [Vibrio harveyi]|uniref:hypothetical protein n=1 Tax=Vibrio harveyi TaxID=669 RepID=UPI003CF18E02
MTSPTKLRAWGFGLSLFILSPYAMAFPLTSISLTQSIMMFLPLLFAPKCKQESRKAWLSICGLLSVLLVGFAYNSAILSRVQLASSEQEYQNFSTENLPKSVRVKSLTGDKAISIMSLNSTLVAHVTRNPEPTIPGSFFYNFNDKELLARRINDGNYKSVVLTSNYSQTAQEFKNYLQDRIHADILYASLSYVDHSNWIQKRGGLSNQSASVHEPQFSNLRHADQLKRINYITIGTDKLFGNDYYGNGPVIPKNRITSLAEADWDEIRGRIDPLKQTVIFFPDIYDAAELAAANVNAKYIAKKLRLSHVDFITERLYFSNQKHYDNAHTSWMPNIDTSVPPARFHHLYQKYDGNVGVICFSQSCENIFPYGSTINAYQSNIVSFGKGFEFKLKPLSRFAGRPIFIAPHDSQSLNVAYNLAEELYKAGYNFQGLTQNPILYFGASYLNGNEVIPDEPIMLFQLDVEAVKDALTPDNPIVLSFESFVFIAFALGCMMVWLKESAIGILSSNLIIMYCFINIDQLALLSSSYYSQQTLEPLQASIIFGVFAWLQIGKPIPAVLISAIIFLFWAQVPPVADTFILIAFMPQMLFMFYDALRDYKANSFNIGGKAQMTLPFTPRSMKGRIINIDDEKLERHCRPGKPYILRSNHICKNEQAMAGIYESHHVTKETISETMQNAVSVCRRSLADNQIQFWLQPLAECTTFGVAASHHDLFALSASYSIGHGDDVTSGKTTSCKPLDRFKASIGLETQLLSMLNEIEAYYKLPVVVEFGIKPDNSILVLQVRPYLYGKSEDPTTGNKWILNLQEASFKKMLIKIEHPIQTVFGQSVINELFQWRVFSDSQSTYALKGTSSSCSSSTLLDSFNQLVELHGSLDSSRSTLGVFLCIKDILGEIPNAYLSLNAKEPSNEQLQSLSRDIRDYIKLNGLVLENDFDCGSKFVQIQCDHHAKSTNCFAARDTYHDLFALSFALIAKHASSQEDKPFAGVTLKSFDKGLTGDWQIVNQEHSHYEVIVDGTFGLEPVTIHEYMLSEEKERLHILTDAIPSSCIEEAMRAASITLRFGSRLCHSALSAKASNTPLRISKS